MAHRTRRRAFLSNSTHAWVPFALFGALLAVGCAGDWSWQRRRKRLTFQVDPGSPLEEPAKRAAAAWSAATGRPITISATEGYPIFVSGSPHCWDGSEGTTGCSFVSSDPDDGYIAVLPHVLPEAYYGVLLHEMGHHLRGVMMPDHVETPTALMAKYRQTEEITQEDVDYACENFDCRRSDVG